MKRKALLDQAVQSGEDAEANAIRKELWEVRYQDKAEAGGDARADGYLALWMSMEFNRDAAGKLFGVKNARKQILKNLEKMKFQETAEKSEMHRELLYKECCHLVRTYMKLCTQDRSYNTMLCGLMRIDPDKAEQKLKNDIYQTAVKLPSALKLDGELELIMKAAREVYEEFFPGEGGLV